MGGRMSGSEEIEDRVTKRNFLRAVGAGATGFAGLYAIGVADLLGVDNRSSSMASSDEQNSVEYTISDTEEIGNYLESDVIGNQELEQEWTGLLSNYDPESGEFFPGEDIELESIDLVYDDRPGEDSGYRITSELDGQTQRSDWEIFEHDETAEEALEYFGGL